MSLRVAPVTLKQANQLVAELHRHHKPCPFHRFSLAVYDGTRLCGVAICGRPVARMTRGDRVLEISRCATDGTRNAVSKLYGAVCRAATAMGFERVQTFTLPSEGGASMRASGFRFVGEAGGGQWTRSGRKPRRTDQPTEVKHKWEYLCEANVAAWRAVEGER